MLPYHALAYYSQSGGLRAVVTPTPEDIANAWDTVRHTLRPTPLLPVAVDIPHQSSKVHAVLKLETFQPTGAFKVRGALAAMQRLPPGSQVITASAGNHALGVAWASAQTGVPATIVIATTASPAKREALANLPVTLVIHGDDFDAAEAHALETARTHPEFTYVSPYNDPHVIAGQATLLDEVLDQTDPERPLIVVAGVGGGGLVAGLSLRAAQSRAEGRGVRIVGVESAESRGVSASVAAGHTVTVAIGDTIADGLSGNIERGSVTVEVIRKHTDQLLTVTDREIRDAMRWLARSCGVICEGAGAAALAAVQSGYVAGIERDATVVMVTSGRNIALPRLAEVLTADQ